MISVGDRLNNGGRRGRLDGFPEVVAASLRRNDPIVEVLGRSGLLVLQLTGISFIEVECLTLEFRAGRLKMLPPFLRLEQLLGEAGKRRRCRVQREAVEMPAAEVE